MIFISVIASIITQLIYWCVQWTQGIHLSL